MKKFFYFDIPLCVPGTSFIFVTSKREKILLFYQEILLFYFADHFSHFLNLLGNYFILLLLGF